MTDGVDQAPDTWRRYLDQALDTWRRYLRDEFVTAIHALRAAGALDEDIDAMVSDAMTAALLVVTAETQLEADEIEAVIGHPVDVAVAGDKDEP